MREKKGGDTNERELARKKGVEKPRLARATEQYLYWHGTTPPAYLAPRTSQRSLSPLESIDPQERARYRSLSSRLASSRAP